jgi:hypothetical protein
MIRGRRKPPTNAVIERFRPAHRDHMLTYQHLLRGMSAAAADQITTLVDAATR